MRTPRPLATHATLRLPKLDLEPRAPPPPELCARCDYWPAEPDGLLCKPCGRLQERLVAA